MIHIGMAEEALQTVESWTLLVVYEYSCSPRPDGGHVVGALGWYAAAPLGPKQMHVPDSDCVSYEAHGREANDHKR